MHGLSAADARMRANTLSAAFSYVAAKRRKLSSPVNAVITCMGKHDSSPTQSSPEMATPVSDSDDTKTAQDRLREKREEAEALVQSETDVMSLWGCSLYNRRLRPLPLLLCRGGMAPLSSCWDPARRIRHTPRYAVCCDIAMDADGPWRCWAQVETRRLPSFPSSPSRSS